MKQKYLIRKEEDKKHIIIQEFAELDKGMLSLLCEETHTIKTLKSAMAKGKDAVVSSIRTANMYPAGVYADKIADSVIALCKSKDKDSDEVFFNDFDLITTRKKKVEAPEPAAVATTQVDEPIEDEYEEDFDEKPTIKKMNTTIDVDGSESTAVDEE